MEQKHSAKYNLNECYVSASEIFEDIRFVRPSKIICQWKSRRSKVRKRFDQKVKNCQSKVKFCTIDD